MSEMTKENARNMLKKTSTMFKKVTGQRVGFWDGDLSILGNNLFTQFINNNSNECLDYVNSSIPTHELELVANIESELSKEYVKSLRRMVP